MTTKERQEQTYTILIDANDRDRTYSCTIKKPDLKVMKTVMALMTPVPQMNKEMDSIGAGQWILETCWIEGDEEIKTDMDLLIAASLQAVTLVNIYDGEIKKN
jgi:hypothetical protein